MNIFAEPRRRRRFSGHLPKEQQKGEGTGKPAKLGPFGQIVKQWPDIFAIVPRSDTWMAQCGLPVMFLLRSSPNCGVFGRYIQSQVGDRRMTQGNIFAGARRFAAALCLATGLASAASASTTFDDVTVGATAIFAGPELEIAIVDAGTGDFFFEAVEIIDVSAFIAFDFDDATETVVASSSPTDLDVLDLVSGDVAFGSALDFAFDYGADQLNILYDLSTNDFSTDVLGVVVLSFHTDIDSSFGFADLDGEPVEFDLFGASLNTPAVPLPATLPLAVAGLASLGWLGRRRKRG